MDIYLMGSVFSWFSDPSNVVSMLKAVFGLGFVIFVHELGHFLVAKACGVKCEKFYVGFDPPLRFLPSALFKRKWGETEYGIGIIPLGGYVKMLGQDDNPANAAQEAERIRRVREEGGGPATEEIDPRSYPAKTVPQRMAIISAGVIMNVIFAFIFATAAYFWGVEYRPTVVQGLSPGTPAWEENAFRPGDKIIQLGRNGTPSEYLRFEHDLLNYIQLSNGEPIEFLVRNGDEEPRWVEVTPRRFGAGVRAMYRTGIDIANPTSISAERATIPDFVADQHAEQFEGGGRIVALEAGGERTEVHSFADIKRALIAHRDQPMTYVLDRSSDSAEADSSAVTASNSVRIEVDPAPLRQLPVGFQVDEIVSIQNNSPADRAGLRKGDVLLSVGGVPANNAFELPHVVDQLAGQTVTVEFLRGTETRTVDVEPVMPEDYEADPMSTNDVPIHSLGLVFHATNELASINPEFSSLGLEPGDEIVGFDIVTSSAKERAELEEKYHTLIRWIEFSDRAGPVTLDDVVGRLPVGTQFKLTYRRGNDVGEATLASAASDEFHSPKRGVNLAIESYPVRTATSLGDAISLGLRETWESITKVFVFLKKLVTGQIAVTSVGGPLTIAIVATSQASLGIPKLLIFLTLLSANLAVLNFMPIPVLDGGHMMFLAYEGVFRKPMPEKLVFGLTMIGLSFILMLMMVAFGMDFYRVFDWLRF